MFFLLLLVAALAVFDVLALRFGYDSRDLRPDQYSWSRYC